MTAGSSNQGGWSDRAHAVRPPFDAIAILSTDPAVRETIADAAGGRCHLARDVADLVSGIAEIRARMVVIDEGPNAREALRHVGKLPSRSHLLVLSIRRDPALAPLRGADVVVERESLEQAVLLASSIARIHERPLVLDRLMSVSLLEGPLDRALDMVADRLAAGFGVDRCLLSVRGDSSGGGAAATRTWSSLTWDRTAERCRVAVASGSTLIAPMVEDPSACESYVAVPLDSAAGNGFLGLVVSRPRLFTQELRAALQAVAKRLATELAWRAVHDRTADDLDRISSGPGLDPLLGIWNRAALLQIATMQVSASRRNHLAVAAAVLDVVDLQSINNRLGLETGDRVLRRVADAVRTTVREEDVVGRLAGDKIAVVLHGVAAESANRVLDRLHAAISARPLELAHGETVPIPVKAGVAVLQATETAGQLLARAAQLAKRAEPGGTASAGEVRSSVPDLSTTARISQQLDAVVEDMGTTIGGTYRLLHEISRGGMGVVYRAQDRALERPVAIKMLRPDLAEDRELVERFRIEAAMLAHLQHPNLVQIYSFGHHGGDSYFVMELVEGESLEQAIERHRLENTAISLVEIPLVIEQIASALDALHDRGIVHRDVKPANVIRDPFRNRSVLVDVGIARRYGQDTPSAGTPGFIAPEVFGEQEATPRADVYGLAATAYAALTLRRPWGDGELVTILARQLNEPLTPPSTYRPELAPLDDVLTAALSPDPAQRPATAGAFARAFAAAVAMIVPRVAPEQRREGSSPSLLREPERVHEVAVGATTRGVVFRSVARAVGVREAERLRDALGGEHPELADALYETAPLSWLDAKLFVRLLEIAPPLVGRDRATLARDVARATVRASFRRFFPASAATLAPERTLSAIRNVWGRYQSWGQISSMPVQATEVVVRLAHTLREPALCDWTIGLLEQLVILSGGAGASVRHDACTCEGADACLFRVTWTRTD
jgi:diguanylate cyclase (GGDEF)-like protein